MSFFTIHATAPSFNAGGTAKLRLLHLVDVDVNVVVVVDIDVDVHVLCEMLRYASVANRKFSSATEDTEVTEAVFKHLGGIRLPRYCSSDSSEPPSMERARSSALLWPRSSDPGVARQRDLEARVIC